MSMGTILSLHMHSGRCAQLCNEAKLVVLIVLVVQGSARIRGAWFLRSYSFNRSRFLRGSPGGGRVKRFVSYGRMYGSRSGLESQC